MMMQESQAVLFRIGMMFFVMLAGWWVARRRWVGPEVSKALGTLVVQVTFPALVFTQMLVCVTPAVIRDCWWIPVAAILSLGVAALIGKAMAPCFRIPAATAGTFVFLVAMPNWVFLPLPIAEALYGPNGVRFVLLFNVGAQLFLWTMGPDMLGAHGRTGRVKSLLGNAGLLATVAGIGCALAFPGACQLGNGHATGVLAAGSDVIVAALRMLGGLTIPLALVVSGSQIAHQRTFEPGDGLPAIGVVVSRLLLAPAVCLLLLMVLSMAIGWHMTDGDYMTFVVIVAMPVAVSCTMFVERYDGDRLLTSKGVLYSTVGSLATVPLFVLFARWLST